MSTPDMPDLRDQIARALRRVPCDVDQVAGAVAPLLAADRADLRIRRNALADVLGLPVSDDERGADFYTLVQRVADLLAAKDQENADAQQRADAAELKLTVVVPTLARVERERDEARIQMSEMDSALLEARARVAELEAREQAVMAALKGVLPEPSVTDAELFKIGDVVFAVVRLVERLRAEVGKLRADLDYAHHAIGQWALGEKRPPWESAPSSGLDGHAAPDTTNLPCCAHPRIVHSGDQCGYPHCPCGKPVAYQDRCEADPKPKPRRDERIDPAGLYTEPTDPGGA